MTSRLFARLVVQLSLVAFLSLTAALFSVKGVAAADFSCGAVSEIPPEECNALVALYESTDGANWIDHANWLVTPTPCADWSGIICTDGRVVEVYLPANNLRGAIPAEMGNLTQVAFLDLSSNQLSGGIPASLANVGSMEELYLQDNSSLSGTLPETFVALTELSLLKLDATNVCGVTDSSDDAPVEQDAAPPTTLETWLKAIENVDGTGLTCELGTLDHPYYLPSVLMGGPSLGAQPDAELAIPHYLPMILK